MTSNNLPYQSFRLTNPGLEIVQKALQKRLPEFFTVVDVQIVDCPDLRNEPFYLTGKGLGGSPAIIDIGGPPYLLPLAKKEKVYDLKEVVKIIDLNPCFVVGAGAGPWPYAGTNSEMIANTFMDKESVVNGTRIAKLDKESSMLKVEQLPNDETRFALMANLFASEGNTSKVLKVSCKHRRIGFDFVTSLRKSIEMEFNDFIGIGGVFILKEGKARQHVMPDFSEIPLDTEKKLNNWLKFFEMPSPLIALGTIVSKEIPDFDLRLQHFHSYNDQGFGGHYHEDITPKQAEYLGYFNIADLLYRIDKPLETHQIGRD